MQRALSDPAPGPSADSTPRFDTLAGNDRRESRNFLVLAVYQIVVRTGWIFKTESILVPAALDMMGGGGWVRGWLTTLSRFGQSIPPLLAARRVKVAPKKLWAFAGWSLMMGISFLLLAWICRTPAWWTAPVFLVGYGIFFASTGINQLIYTTLQGKLIRVTRRGRLLLISNCVGAVTAIACAAWLLPRWLQSSGANFPMIFAVAGAFFVLSALVALFLDEPSDNYIHPSRGVRAVLGASLALLRHDANFRRLALVAALFGSSIMLFPHYQALGRGDRLQMDLSSLIHWVIIQNLGTGIFSFVAGPIADRHGNRAVLRFVMLALAAVPLAAIALSYLGEGGQVMFSMIFLVLGLTPVTIKILNNYTLEIAGAADHPQYLSTLSLCVSLPSLLSPGVGWIVDVAGFDVAFLLIGTFIFAGWLMTLALTEPRHHQPSAAAPNLSDGA